MENFLQRRTQNISM